MEAFNERLTRSRKPGATGENNKKWTGRKEPAGIEDGERAVKKGEDGGGETSLVPRKLLAGEYTAATDLFRGTSRGLYVLMYSLIGLPFSPFPHTTPPFNPSRSPLRGLFSGRYMLMESYIWFIMRSRSADEYHLY